MSALLRALIGQQSGGDKPNMAVVTDSGLVPLNSLSGRNQHHMDITAKLEEGKSYRVRFKWSIDVQEVSEGSHAFGFGNYNFWHNINKFVKFFTSEVKTYSGEVDEIAECFFSDNATKKYVFQADNQHIRGNARIYDVIIQEV